VCLTACSTLVPKANSWLLETSGGLQLIKCETTERRVTSYGDVTADNVLFAPKDGHAIYVKGLRYSRRSRSFIKYILTSWQNW